MSPCRMGVDRWYLSGPAARSALLDHVALCRAEGLLHLGAEGLARVRVEPLVAGANGPLVRHAGGREVAPRGHLAAASEEEHRHLDAGAADLHLGLHGVLHHEVGEGVALLQRARARAVAEDRLAL